MIQNHIGDMYKHIIESNTINAKQIRAHLRDKCPRDNAPSPIIFAYGELELATPLVKILRTR